MRLTAEMCRVIEEQRLGFVATVGPDGVPNLSPKGTFAVLDGNRLAFADIRSPVTLKNLQTNPNVEINFVDPFTRKGFRFKGRATIIKRGAETFGSLVTTLVGAWKPLAGRVKAVVVIDVLKASVLSSPAYDTGSTEDELRAHWTDHFRKLQPSGTFHRE